MGFWSFVFFVFYPMHVSYAPGICISLALAMIFFLSRKDKKNYGAMRLDVHVDCGAPYGGGVLVDGCFFKVFRG